MKKGFAVVLVVVASYFISSCASAPPAPPAQPEPQPAQPEAQAVTIPAPDAERAKATELQKRVNANGLGPFDPDDYAAAETAFTAGEGSYGKDNESARRSFVAAADAYTLVLSKGGTLFLTREQKSAETSKSTADELKASVAVKDAYSEALAVYQRGVQESGTGDIENAAKDFAEARDAFAAVAVTAKEKKDAALTALDLAEKGRASSEQQATDAQNALQEEGFGVTGTAQ
jgi:hypothetical protein